MRHLFAGLAAVLVLGLIIWALLPRPVGVELADVALRTIEVVVEEEGEARIREVFTVSATVAGKLQRIILHAGDPVVAEETVVALIGSAAPALLDARARAVAEATVEAAAAAVDLASAQVAQAEATLVFMTAEADRARALLERLAVPQRTYDNAILQQLTARAAADSAHANLAVREQELESARAVLGMGDANGTPDCCIELISPVSGQVLRVLSENEQVVPSGAPILEVGDPGNLDVTVKLLSRDAVRVQEGARAEITGWGGPSIAAVVERVEPSALTQVSALGIDEQRVEVILALRGDPAERRLLGHGFRVIARIALWREEEVLSVPVGALFRDGSDWATYVVHDGRARFQTISLGERNEAFAQVLDGLQPGDQVILHPSDLVTDGVAVAP
ncbi:efflux RND transporter periplasmic adaptor subunit [Cypionkella sp.]|uniref:efflux RND transporter periplasmic adaptor subunit n=1 Tax=Cypionkella sp. TaxID=2811411 RepID=UPI0027285CE1|nr:HlyD family efflux transporter periplasmic adaptor subunit [Cypionkella sp.]MDO8985902.1 HlyD family efflux transporter periplasmic adaptor subunit [Cypionkella sp.]MDP2049288.1 HlyD family efflux transporter periplasmic adaptor subunit [Cypionkella sp.]